MDDKTTIIVSVVVPLILVLLGSFFSWWKIKGAKNRYQQDKQEMNLRFLELCEKKEIWTGSQIWKNPNFLSTKSTSSHHLNDTNRGIYAIYVNNFEDKFLLPCYVGKSEHIGKRWVQHIKQIYKAYTSQDDEESSATYQKIASYLNHCDLTINDLRFVVIEIVAADQPLDKKEKYWINKIGTAKRGWNAIKASKQKS